MSYDSSTDLLAHELRRLVARLKVGDRLPSSRTLMAEHGVGPATVQRAIGQLVVEGVVATRPGAGTYVARRAERALADTDWQQITLGASPVEPSGVDLLFARAASDAVPFGTGYLDASTRSDGRLAAAMARAARRPDAWAVPPSAGIPGLRAWFAGELGAAVDDVLITSGGQGALSASMRAILRAGSPVLFAVPTYPGAVAVARSAGLVPIPVPADGDGVRPELLEEAFAATNARLLYLQPTFANPDCHVLAASRRAEVLEIAARAGAFVIEDDHARWLGHGGAVPAPLVRDDDDGHVITINSLTKAAAPSLRVGAVTARGPVAQRIAAMRLVDDFFVARPLQEAALEFVSGSSWQAHLRALSQTLRRRFVTLEQSLARHLPDCPIGSPRGGLHVWLRLPPGVDDAAAADRAALLGISVAPGRLFTVGESASRHLRVSYASVAEECIDKGIARLADAIDGLR